MPTTAIRHRQMHAPETWVYLVAAAAMTALAIHHLGGYTAGEVAGVPHHQHGHHLPDPAPAAQPGPVATWLWWMAMAVAMMLPVAAPSARRIARAGLWRRRHIAIAEYLGGYLCVWGLVGLAAVLTVAAVWPAGAPVYAVPVALLIAAIWQINPVRRRTLSRCRGAGFINVRGWQTDRDCLAEGWKDGVRCLVTCGPVMAVMAVGHSLIVMLAITALLLSERARGPNPARRAGRPFEAICLAGLAALTFLWGITSGTPLP